MVFSHHGLVGTLFDPFCKADFIKSNFVLLNWVQQWESLLKSLCHPGCLNDFMGQSHPHSHLLAAHQTLHKWEINLSGMNP